MSDDWLPPPDPNVQPVSLGFTPVAPSRPPRSQRHVQILGSSAALIVIAPIVAAAVAPTASKGNAAGIAFFGLAGVFGLVTAGDAIRRSQGQFRTTGDNQALFIVAPLLSVIYLGLPFVAYYWLHLHPRLEQARLGYPISPPSAFVERAGEAWYSFRQGLTSATARRTGPRPTRVFVPMPPEQAAAVVAGSMAQHGYVVTVVTPTMVSGSMYSDSPPSALVAVLLFIFCCFVGMLIYLLTARRSSTVPITFSLYPMQGGTMVVPSSPAATRILGGIGQPI